ncbi:hypothetical protein C8Q77DRAFT_606942 [Trametes polyzona]|nr:hypothetical protein C8Q77DRAFT_606942 [Trametes polyzona]
MSETSIQLQTQATFIDGSVSLDSAGRPVIVHDLSQARRQTKYKPKFAEFVCSPGEVYRYVVLVTKAVVPQAFWGSARNFDVVMQSEQAPC